MPKDKEERRKDRRTDRRTDRRARVKKKLPAVSNGTVQRLREARKENKELKARLAQYERQPTVTAPTPAEQAAFDADHPTGHTPPSEAVPPE